MLGNLSRLGQPSLLGIGERKRYKEETEGQRKREGGREDGKEERTILWLGSKESRSAENRVSIQRKAEITVGGRIVLCSIS